MIARRRCGDAIVVAAGVPANAVTEAHLAAIRGLNLSLQKITSLKTGDFDGLNNLTELYLYGNELSTLPTGIFNNLTQLTKLWLWDNNLSTLPSGIFAGLTELTTLRLQGNAVDPLPLPVSLEAVSNGVFKAVASTGAPFDIVLPLVVANGSLTTDATTVTISKGQVESTALTVNRTPGTSGAVSVNIGGLPGIPTDVGRGNVPNHQGYALVKSGTLPLVVISGIADPPPPTDDPPTNNPPIFAEGASTTRTIAENTAAGTHIGSAVSATDADNDTLTYTLSGTDAAAFSIVSTTGQLRTQAALNAAIKSVYFVTVTVSDGKTVAVSGGVHTVTISVIINVTDVEMPPVLDVNSDGVSVDITDLVTVAASFGATVDPTTPESGRR